MPSLRSRKPMLRPARARWILTRNKKLSACYFQGRQKERSVLLPRPLCSMNPIFHPVPRISAAPSGKISHPSPAPPWTLPPTAESNPAPAREVECFSCRKITSVPATAVSARCRPLLRVYQTGRRHFTQQNAPDQGANLRKRYRTGQCSPERAEHRMP